MAALVLSVLPLAAALRIPEETSTLAVVNAVVWLELHVVLGAAGAMFLARWRITCEPRVGWLAAAMVMLSLSGAPFAAADLLDVGHRSGGTGDLMSLVLAAPVLLLMALAANGNDIPDRVHPAVLGMTLGLLLLSIRLAAGPSADDAWTLPQPESAIAAVALATAYVMVLVIWRNRVERAVTSASHFVAIAACLLAVMLLDPVGTTGDTLTSRTSVVALFLLSVWVLITGVGVLLEALSEHTGRLLAAAGPHRPAPPDLTEERRRREELFHELRSTVADISTASQILLRDDDRLSASSRDRLAAGLATEVARLQRLVDEPADEPAGDPADSESTVALDQVVAPLVACQRAAGHDIRWEPSGHHVHGKQDDISEIVHILLHNSLRHAPGTPVSVSVHPRAGAMELRVSDGGPGIPEAIRDSLFQRGVRSAESPGSGLGLYLARRLAGQQGGDLQLRNNDGVHGASFVVTLPQCHEEHM